MESCHILYHVTSSFKRPIECIPFLSESMEDVSHHTEAAPEGEPTAVGRNRSPAKDQKNKLTVGPCILCQEQQEVGTDGRAVVMAAFVQKSTVLSKSRGKMFENGDVLDPLYPGLISFLLLPNLSLT